MYVYPGRPGGKVSRKDVLEGAELPYSTFDSEYSEGLPPILAFTFPSSPANYSSRAGTRVQG